MNLFAGWFEMVKCQTRDFPGTYRIKLYIRLSFTTILHWSDFSTWVPVFRTGIFSSTDYSTNNTTFEYL